MHSNTEAIAVLASKFIDRLGGAILGLGPDNELVIFVYALVLDSSGSLPIGSLKLRVRLSFDILKRAEDPENST